MSDTELMTLARMIISEEDLILFRLLDASSALATARFSHGATRQEAKRYFLDEIEHYITEADTALHIAAAAYRHEMARKLITIGTDIRTKNCRGAEPLHYASIGMPGSSTWNPERQAATVTCLIENGADPNAMDKRGVTPLHRAVRTRCAAAVKALLEGGADPGRRSRTGSTPMLLATKSTGRGGTGSPEAKGQQERIVHLIQEHLDNWR